MPSALRRSRFPDGQSWLSLSRVFSAVEGGPGGSRMRELCELCRISGSTLLTNSSSKGQTSTHRRNEEQDFCLLPAGSIDAISMLTSARESRNGSSPTGRTKRRDSKAPLTENLTVLQSHLPKTKESSPRGPLSALQAPFVKNPSRAKFLLRLSCRSLHFGLCFSPPSPSFNLPCLWKCRRHLRPRQTHPRHLHRHPHHLEKMGRSRKWRWKMRGERSRLPQEQRKMLP